jgi:PD-(D/E)XK nuclease superfamily
MHKIIMDGDAGKFQATFTAFLQEHLSLFCVPRHQEKVYQALSFMLIYSLFDTADRRYNVRMEQDDGFGRSDITAHPRTLDCLVSLVFEIKRVATHSKKSHGKRQLKSADRLRTELIHATDDALEQIQQRQYRARAPLHTRTIHEYGLAFAGKFCVVAVRTLQRKIDAGDWVEVDCGTPVVAKDISDTDLVGDDSDGDNMDVDEQM